MTLQQFVSKLILPQEASEIFGQAESANDGIEVGKLSNFDAEIVVQLMDIWCKRIDKLIEIDKTINNNVPSWRSHLANRWRGFTYTEYQALFNIHISETEFAYYPVFAQLRQDKGGVNSEKSRADLLANYEYNEEDFIRILCKNRFEPLLNTFFSQFAKLSALMPLDKLKRHVYICSPTGTGKSELLRTMFQRMVTKYPLYSFILIDPHGSLALSCKRLKSVGGNPDRVVYLEPFLKEGRTPTFNPFEISDISLKNLTFTAEQIISAIEETLSREGGKLTEVQLNMLEKCVYFLLKRRNSTMLDLVSLLNAEAPIIDEAQQYDPNFFNDYYRKPNNRTREAIGKRIERLLNSPVLRNLLGGNSTFDLEEIVNSGKILIVNLGDLSEMTQIMIGKFLVASIKSVIRKRKKNTGLQTFLFVDEVQNMISGSFDFMLSQLRGFNLSCIMANQYLSQLGDQAESVKQNTAIKIVGGEDYDDIKKVLKVPKETYLKDYEFFLKVSGYKIRLFQSLDAIIKNPKRYEISKEKEKEFDRIQVERHTRIYDQQNVNQRKATHSKTETKDISKPSNDSPIPPFEIFIKDK